MVADPKRELHALIDQLSDDDAAKTLAYVRQLLGGTYPSPARPQSDAPARPHALPTLHRASAIGSIDDLRTALFAPADNRLWIGARRTAARQARRLIMWTATVAAGQK
jgi:hypothetical protein